MGNEIKQKVYNLLYAALIAWAILVGLDNIFFQPHWPGLLIGGIVLIIAGFALYTGSKHKGGE